MSFAGATRHSCEAHRHCRACMVLESRSRHRNHQGQRLSLVSCLRLRCILLHLLKCAYSRRHAWHSRRLRSLVRRCRGSGRRVIGTATSYHHDRKRNRHCCQRSCDFLGHRTIPRIQDSTAGSGLRPLPQPAAGQIHTPSVHKHPSSR